MVFQVTPDGDAAVSGAITDLTPLQMQTIAAGNITDLGTQHGLDTLFVRSGGQFQVFYVSPDNERLIPGVMWDASGKDLTRDQVTKIPGAVPTVVIGSGNNDQPLAPTAPGGADLPLVEKASAGAEGPSTAPHLWMLVDPQCIYSIRAMQMLQPYVVSGRLQLSVVPLSVLDYEDKGQSTRSALALLSKPADKIIAAWQSGDVGGAPGPEANQRLAANMAIAHSIGLRGTPTLVWRKPDGTEGRIDGVPTSIDALLASMGS
jgi:thiol:disulfide interchange protein DsbG